MPVAVAPLVVVVDPQVDLLVVLMVGLPAALLVAPEVLLVAGQLAVVVTVLVLQLKELVLGVVAAAALVVVAVGLAEALLRYFHQQGRILVFQMVQVQSVRSSV